MRWCAFYCCVVRERPAKFALIADACLLFRTTQGLKRCCKGLVHREGASVVAQLPRRAGRRDAEYVHLLGDETPDSPSTSQIALAPVANPPNTLALDDLMIRVTMLEAQVERLQAEIDVLKR